MKKMMKSKKGDAFVIGLIFIAIIVFTYMAYAIAKNNQDRVKESTPLGLQATYLKETYNEAERANYYIELSGKAASTETLDTLAANAGYLEKNKCKKTENILGQGSYIIFDSSCEYYNPEQAYYNVLENTMKKYLENYNSTYGIITNSQNSSEEIINNYTRAVRNLKVANNKGEIKSITTTFEPIFYEIEKSPDSFYMYTIKISTPKPDLSDYNTLYTALFECKKKINEPCDSIIKQYFPSAIISNSGNLLMIETKSINNIRLAFDKNAELPQNKIGSFS